MALNVDQLREGLKSYHKSLEKHNAQLKSDFDRLQKRYLSFAAQYEGRAAQEFKQSWQATAAWFKNYIDQTRSLSIFLNDRIKFLENESR